MQHTAHRMFMSQQGRLNDRRSGASPIQRGIKHALSPTPPRIVLFTMVMATMVTHCHIGEHDGDDTLPLLLRRRDVAWHGVALLQMVARVEGYVDRLVDAVKPRRFVLVAIDGVAPVAKMAQQRTRRFLSAYVQEVTDRVGGCGVGGGVGRYGSGWVSQGPLPTVSQGGFGWVRTGLGGWARQTSCEGSTPPVHDMY